MPEIDEVIRTKIKFWGIVFKHVTQTWSKLDAKITQVRLLLSLWENTKTTNVNKREKFFNRVKAFSTVALKMPARGLHRDRWAIRLKIYYSAANLSIFLAMKQKVEKKPQPPWIQFSTISSSYFSRSFVFDRGRNSDLKPYQTQEVIPCFVALLCFLFISSLWIEKNLTCQGLFLRSGRRVLYRK